MDARPISAARAPQPAPSSHARIRKPAGGSATRLNLWGGREIWGKVGSPRRGDLVSAQSVGGEEIAWGGSVR